MSTNLQRAEHDSANVANSMSRMSPASHRDPLATAALSRRAFNAVLSTACTKHNARAGAACWPMPPSRDRPVLSVCGDRIAVTLGGTR